MTSLYSVFVIKKRAFIISVLTYKDESVDLSVLLMF